jgi:type I restriction enzyme M protein
MSIPKPRWFRADKVMVSTAPTVGISKSGGILAKYDPETGKKIEVADNNGGTVEVIDDQLVADMEALRDGGTSPTLHLVDRADVSLRLAVPTYYDRRFHAAFVDAMKTPAFEGFTSVTIADLIADGRLTVRAGHGSAPKDLRVGEVPYIKVSDLRAGLMNVNPTNRVPLKWAETLWKGSASGLKEFDLLSPERASRNIGDFCVLMPGQEQVLLTKEIIILRAGPAANFDQFYLLWAMSLRIVRDQWNRVVFMQTNREDVGKRYHEIEIPIAPSPERAAEISEPFRRYFLGIAEQRRVLRDYLRPGDHHFFLSGVEAPAQGIEVELEADAVETVL